MSSQFLVELSWLGGDTQLNSTHLTHCYKSKYFWVISLFISESLTDWLKTLAVNQPD
jgi:hypothetical protein